MSSIWRLFLAFVLLLAVVRLGEPAAARDVASFEDGPEQPIATVHKTPERASLAHGSIAPRALPSRGLVATPRGRARAAATRARTRCGHGRHRAHQLARRRIPQPAADDDAH